MILEQAAGDTNIRIEAELIGTLILISCALGLAAGGVYVGCPGMIKGRAGDVVVGVPVAGGRRPRALSEAISGFSAKGEGAAGCTAAARVGADTAGCVYG